MTTINMTTADRDAIDAVVDKFLTGEAFSVMIDEALETVNALESPTRVECAEDDEYEHFERFVAFRMRVRMRQIFGYGTNVRITDQPAP